MHACVQNRRPIRIMRPNRTAEPVLRFCKSDAASDILIPIFHFHMKDYNA
jgi:hypothetical protein